MEDDPRVDDVLRARLDEIEDGYKSRYRSNRALIQRFNRRVLRILSVLVLVQLVVGGLALRAQFQTDGNVSSVHRLVAANTRTIREVRQQAVTIQQQRITATWDACAGQNRRNRQTVERLDRLTARIRDPAERKRALAGRSFTVSLIDTLAPKADCVTLVAKRADLHGAALAATIQRLEHR